MVADRGWALARCGRSVGQRAVVNSTAEGPGRRRGRRAGGGGGRGSGTDRGVRSVEQRQAVPSRWRTDTAGGQGSSASASGVQSRRPGCRHASGGPVVQTLGALQQEGPADHQRRRPRGCSTVSEAVVHDRRACLGADPARIQRMPPVAP